MLIYATVGLFFSRLVHRGRQNLPRRGHQLRRPRVYLLAGTATPFFAVFVDSGTYGDTTAVQVYDRRGTEYPHFKESPINTTVTSGRGVGR